MPAKPSLAKRLARIRLVAFDVDGVLADGKITYDEKGRELKSFDAHDGYGITRGIRCGLRMAIITGRGGGSVERRARELGIREVHQEVADKGAVYARLKRKLRLADADVCYIGDDEPDLPVLLRAGVSGAPADAMPGIRRRVDIVTREKGGRGAVRAIIDMVLHAKGLL